ncbi:Integrase core domain [Popillia japonica]|uniref:Integrase core domain n=1 Tax=Popillia japonica TaxID=7064 RepID=A0AAW1K2C6_POPJA
MDHLGPFITTRGGKQYILVLCDNLTRFVSSQAVRTTKTEPNVKKIEVFIQRFGAPESVVTVKKIEVFIQRFGAPESVVTDRGTCFTSKKFENFCKEYGIRHTLNSSRHPQANGLVNEWKYRGYIPRFKDGNTRRLTISNETYTYPQFLRDESVKQMVIEQQKYKTRYDRNRHKNVKYVTGDIVFMKAATTSTGESTADLRDDLGERYITTAHVNQLKVWKTNTEDEESDEEINASDEKPDVSDKEVETERQRCSIIRKRSVCEKDIKNYTRRNYHRRRRR